MNFKSQWNYYYNLYKDQFLTEVRPDLNIRIEFLQWSTEYPMKKSMPNAGIYDMIYYGQDRWCNKHADYDAAYDATTIRYCINYWSKEFTIGYLEMFEWYE